MFPVQVLPVQVFPVQVLPVQVFPVQVLPIHDPPVHVFPVQVLPVHEPPDQAVPASRAVVQPKPSHVVRKTLCSPTTGVPFRVTWLVPRASSSEPVPSERGQDCLLSGVAAAIAALTSSIPLP